jgi:tRNA threonylcarbamoyladenosine biosynthesis protein TsaE
MSDGPAQLTLDLPDQQATASLGARIAALLGPGDAVLLEGPLGAGKTTLARALLRALVTDPALEVPSPSYTLVQEYETPRGPVWHLDLWRLEGQGDLRELGWEEARAGIVLVEWPDRLGALRPKEALTISLFLAPAESRHAVLTGWPDRLALLNSTA